MTRFDCFRRDQELALDYVHGRLGIPVPRTAFAWAADAHKRIAAVSSIAIADALLFTFMGWELKSSILTFTSITTMDLQDSVTASTSGGFHCIGISGSSFPIRLMILGRSKTGYAMQ